MAAFSYQYPPFLVDSVLVPNNSVKNQGLLDEFFPNLDQIFPLSGNLQQEGSSIDGSIHGSSCIEPSIVNEKQRSESLVSSMADVTDSGEQVTQNLAKKRRSRNGFSSDSANSKNVKQVKCKKHKGEKEAMKDVKNEKRDQNEAPKEPPKGYIHVRARRGQATDSHSLAERVRREKINERMKMLQALVPGCDKVTGKALMLDEIINYVQSLQNQVEFLSLKLASLDPMVYTFGLMDMDPMTFGAQGMSNSMALVPPPPLIQSTTTSATTSNTAQPFSDTNAISSATASPKAATTTTSFPSTLVDTSARLLQQEQKQTVHPLQEGRSSYWGVLDDHQRQQSIINQFGFDTNSLYSLQ